MQTISSRPFSDRALIRLLIPLVMEQLLSLTVGLVDTVMVSNLGEAVVSSVSLVDTVNVLLVNLFTALASGGAIVTGQYLGSRVLDRAQRSAEQLLLFLGAVSLVVTAMMYALRYFVIHVLFGAVAADVAAQAEVYFNIVELSIPFLGIYSAGAALFRVMGDSRTSMRISLVMNLINIGGNAFLIFVAKWGVSGVAVPTLASRVFAAAAVLWLLRKETLPIHLSRSFRLAWDRQTVGQIVRFGVPNGIDGSFFQLGKILLLSVAAQFGTTAITANSVANAICSFHCMPGMAVGVAMVTVVSQCAGRKDFEDVRYYTRRLLLWCYVLMGVFNLAMLAAGPAILGLYAVSEQTFALANRISFLHGVMCMILWSPSFALPQSLRACGDTRFVMLVSVGSMWTFRLILGTLLATRGGFGVEGIWFAMYADWLCRITCFLLRWRGGKWKTKAL